MVKLHPVGMFIMLCSVLTSWLLQCLLYFFHRPIAFQSTLPWHWIKILHTHINILIFLVQFDLINKAEVQTSIRVTLSFFTCRSQCEFRRGSGGAKVCDWQAAAWPDACEGGPPRGRAGGAGLQAAGPQGPGGAGRGPRPGEDAHRTGTHTLVLDLVVRHKNVLMCVLGNLTLYRKLLHLHRGWFQIIFSNFKPKRHNFMVKKCEKMNSNPSDTILYKRWLKTHFILNDVSTQPCVVVVPGSMW